MSSVTKVIKTIELDLTDIPVDKRANAKKEVGDYLVNSILREVGNGKSPVHGEKFKKLTKKYAKDEHGGRRLPILEVEGDMLEALRSKNKAGNKIEVGIRGTQAPKADGHNQLSGEAKQWAADTDRVQYKRRFIPDSAQKFTGKINKGVDDILAGYREQARDEREERQTIEIGRADSVTETPEATQVTTNDIFSDDAIEELLLQALREQGRL